MLDFVGHQAHKPESSCHHNYVDECPFNRTSWELRVDQFSCNCSSKTMMYHCLLTEDSEKIVEGCLKPKTILQGHCPVFSKGKEISVKSCFIHHSSCPNKSYQSTDVYKYPECLNEKRNINSDEDINEALNTWIVTYILIPAIIVCAVFIRLCMRPRKLRQESLTEMPTTMPSDLNEVRVLLLGPTGSGKSSTGNTILNKMCFKTGISSSGITFHCQKETANRFGRKIVVLDTPGFSNLTKTVRRTELTLLGNPDATLLILDLSRFSIDLEMDLQNVTHHFGENIFDTIFIIFTREDELQRHCISLQDFISTFPPSMLILQEKCNSRIKSVNNLRTGSENTAFVKELIKDIDNLKYSKNLDDNIFVPQTTTLL